MHSLSGIDVLTLVLSLLLLGAVATQGVVAVAVHVRPLQCSLTHAHRLLLQAAYLMAGIWSDAAADAVGRGELAVCLQG